MVVTRAKVVVQADTLSLEVIFLEGQENKAAQDQSPGSAAADDEVRVVDGTGHLTLGSPRLGPD